MDLYRTLYFMFLGSFLLSIPLLHECRKLDGYKFPVYTTDFCPRNQTEWETRSTSFNCTGKSSYACFPNENITELLEFCYPLEVIAITKDVCLFLRKARSELDGYFCTNFQYGCPTSNYVGDIIYKYPGCVLIGNGCFLAEPSCESTTQHKEEDGQQDSNGSKLVWILSFVGVFIVLAAMFIFFFIHRRRKLRLSKRKRTNRDVENLDEEKRALLSEEDFENSIFRQWQKDDVFFISTKAAKEVETLIKTNNLVIVTGHSGSGKSAIVQHIALKYRKQGWVIKPVHNVEEIYHAQKSGAFKKDKTIFVYHDPFGKEYFDEMLYNSWSHYRETLKLFIEEVKILLTCRKSVLYDPKVKGFLKGTHITVDIDSNQLKLSPEEKRLMFNKHVSNKQLTEEEFTIILETDVYYPLLCKLCSGKSKSPKNILKVFNEPVEILKEEIENYKNRDKKNYCALICLVLFNNKLCLEDLIKSNTIYLKCLDLSDLPQSTSSSTIFKQLEHLEGFFVKKIGQNYSFYHDLVMEVTTFVLGTDSPKETIEYADISFIRTRIRLENSAINDKFTILLNDAYTEDLVNRLFEELFKDRFIEVVLNPCLKEKKVINGFRTKFENDKEKLERIVTTKTTKSENQDVNIDLENMKENWYSRLEFVSSGTEVSPLFALIAFRHDDLSKFCLDQLQENKLDFKNSFLFAAACCNGNKDFIETLTKKGNTDTLMEVWNNMYPIHIVSLFHNYDLLDDAMINSQDVNMFTNHEHPWTPLLLASANDTEDSRESSTNSTAFARDVTVRRLIKIGAEVNLCRKNGCSPLCIACQNGHDSTVQLLLNNGAEVNLCMKNGAGPLYVACQNGHDSTVQLLLNIGAKVNLCEEHGASPLYIACQNGHDSTVQLLLNSGADVNLCKKNGAGPLYIACQNGHDSTVQLLLSNGANVNLYEEDGASPLYIACQKGHDSTVQLLLNNGAEVNLCMKNGASPLYFACQKGHDSTVQLLLNSGADVNLCKKNGAGPLYVACQNGHDSTVQLLLNNGAEVNLCIKNGAGPLYVACQNGHDSTVQLLLNIGAKVNLCEEHGASPLYIACQNGHDSTVQLLLNNGAEVNLCKKNGAGPLYIACQNGHDSTVQLLLSNGANVNLYEEDGASPLYIACQNGHDSTVQLLLNNGAEVNLCMKNGASPLYFACQKGHDSTVQLLLNSGADVNLCKKNGAGPLYVACQNGHDSTVQLLLNNGAEVNLCMKNGASPLYFACQKGHDSTVQLLLNSGADVNLCKKNGAGPLYVACQNGHDSTVQLLLNNGAEVNLCKKNGAGPLYVACQNGHDSTVQLLLNIGAKVNLCEEHGASPLYIACQNGHDST